MCLYLLNSHRVSRILAMSCVACTPCGGLWESGREGLEGREGPSSRRNSQPAECLVWFGIEMGAVNAGRRVFEGAPSSSSVENHSKHRKQQLQSRSFGLLWRVASPDFP